MPLNRQKLALGCLPFHDCFLDDSIGILVNFGFVAELICALVQIFKILVLAFSELFLSLEKIQFNFARGFSVDRWRKFVVFFLHQVSVSVADPHLQYFGVFFFEPFFLCVVGSFPLWRPGTVIS